MSALQFVLECALVAVVVGAVVSVIVATLFGLARTSVGRLAPSWRADVLFVAAVLPATVAIAVTIAAAGPSVLAALGLHHDHCGTHLHHAHLCVLHAFDVPMSRTLLGAAALGLLAFQAIRLTLGAAARHRTLRALEALGTNTTVGRFSVVCLPGEPRLCHAVGLRRRRVLLSKSLASAIGDDELEAALAHEAAHHDRWDGLATFFVRLSAAFHPPWLMQTLVDEHRVATEEAADSRAAGRVGSAQLVAAAIVSIARVQVGAPVLDNGITGTDIERRVVRLLDGAEDRPSLGLPGVAFACLITAGLILAGADHVHHAVETLLHLI